MSKWKGRGEAIFLKLPRFGSFLYDHLMSGSPMQLHFAEIARELANLLPSGRLLDVGTGPGRLLQAIHGFNPAIQLYGLDISASMLRLAQKNLSGMGVNLQQGNIRHTDYPADYFDLVTCTGSFYLWEQPERGLDEIYRILKPGQSACLFECDRESDRQAFQAALQKNLRQLNRISRIFGPLALRQALDAAYSKNEIGNIIKRTSFAHSYSLDEITIGGLPIWMRITLRKS